LRAREVAINNDFRLKKEADVMGRAASRDLTLEKEPRLLAPKQATRKFKPGH
jgi:hypothetical protein